MLWQFQSVDPTLVLSCVCLSARKAEFSFLVNFTTYYETFRLFPSASFPFFFFFWDILSEVLLVSFNGNYCFFKYNNSNVSSNSISLKRTIVIMLI